MTHLRRNQVTDLRIDFFARLELPGGKTVELPLRRLTYERRIETDIFGTKPATADVTNGSATRTTTKTAADGTTTGETNGTTTDDGLLALGAHRALVHQRFPSVETTRRHVPEPHRSWSRSPLRRSRPAG